MYKTYNRIYTEPDTHKMKLIKIESIGNKFTSPKAYYDKHASTLLIQYTYMRICLRDGNTRYELGYHHEYTKRTVAITNTPDTKLTELALRAITEDLGGSGLKGLTFNYYNITTNSEVPNPWIKYCSSNKDDEIAKQLFYVLDLEIEQNMFIQPCSKYMIPLLKQELPNGRSLSGYGTWKYSRKPLDRNGLTEIVYIPKTKCPNPS